MIIVCPELRDPVEAVRWLLEQGCTHFYVRIDPDGIVRGHGVKEWEIPGIPAGGPVTIRLWSEAKGGD